MTSKDFSISRWTIKGFKVFGLAAGAVLCGVTALAILPTVAFGGALFATGKLAGIFNKKKVENAFVFAGKVIAFPATGFYYACRKIGNEFSKEQRFLYSKI
jgi:hypothetical protein